MVTVGVVYWEWQRNISQNTEFTNVVDLLIFKAVNVPLALGASDMDFFVPTSSCNFQDCNARH